MAKGISELTEYRYTMVMFESLEGDAEVKSKEVGTCDEMVGGEKWAMGKASECFIQPEL